MHPMRTGYNNMNKAEDSMMFETTKTITGLLNVAS